MRIKTYTFVILLTVLTLTTLNTLNTQAAPALTLTVQTDKTEYNLSEKIVVGGSLTLDGSPVTDALVGVQINDASDSPITYRTLPTGTPPSDKKIEILEVLPCTDLGDPHFRFSNGSYASFKVTVRNNYPEPLYAELALTCYYEPYAIPFIADIFYKPNFTGTIFPIIFVPIPPDAIIGAAKIYCSAYSKAPEKVTGVPYCPEVSADFMIISSESSSGITEQPSQSPPAGTYQLSFEISEQAGLGKYTVYAISGPTKQSFAYNQFEVVQLPRLKVVPRLSIPKTGDSIQLNIAVVDVSNLTGWEIKVYYNSTILNATQIVEGSFLSTVGTTTFQIYQITDNYNSTHGIIWATCSLNSKDIGANGAGTLATITFKAKASKGNTPIHLQDTQLTDNKTPPAYIQHTNINGLVYIGSHNIAITNVTPYKILVGQKSILLIYVTVKNNGNYAEAFNATVYVNTTFVQTQNITLQTSESLVVTFTWNTTLFSIYTNYTISANATEVQDETDTEDNIYTDGTIKLVIQGDVNGDGIVDVFDAVLLSNIVGTRPWSPNWNPNCDLNCDTIIDIFDAVLLAANAGKHYP